MVYTCNSVVVVYIYTAVECEHAPHAAPHKAPEGVDQKSQKVSGHKSKKVVAISLFCEAPSTHDKMQNTMILFNFPG